MDTLDTSPLDTLEIDKDDHGRTRYTIAGVLTTYDPQEALDLMATGKFVLNCPLTRQAAAPPRFAHRTVPYMGDGDPHLKVISYDTHDADAA